jgi:hypothetical protein
LCLVEEHVLYVPFNFTILFSITFHPYLSIPLFTFLHSPSCPNRTPCFSLSVLTEKLGAVLEDFGDMLSQAMQARIVQNCTALCCTAQFCILYRIVYMICIIFCILCNSDTVGFAAYQTMSIMCSLHGTSHMVIQTICGKQKQR